MLWELTRPLRSAQHTPLVFNSPSVLLLLAEEINPTPKHTLSLCACSWSPLCPYTQLFFFFFPLPCPQFTGFHSDSECTLLTWTDLSQPVTHRGGVLQSKPQWSVCSVECVQALMMTNEVQKAWHCNCYEDHLPLIPWCCRKHDAQCVYYTSGYVLTCFTFAELTVHALLYM